MSTDRLGAGVADDVRQRIEELIEQYRAHLDGCLDGLTEDQARTRLVESDTTLLGLVKHATYLEGFYYDRAITGRPLKDIGVASTPARSFVLNRADTVESVLQAHRRQCEHSRETVAGLAFDSTAEGDRPRAVWAIHLQMLRELAHHAGHADILREQVLALHPGTAGKRAQ